jgi:uncharacterized membrane protein YhaH (DUF805 family)
MWLDIKDWQKTYFGFQGRYNRARYWLHSVMAFVVAFILELFAVYMFPIPDQLIMIFHSETVQKAIMGIISVAPAVTFVYISTAISVKRLHDRDKSGWWALFYLGLPSLVLVAIVAAADEQGHVAGWPAALVIPYLILLIVTFVELACLKGTTGPNRFGADPLAAHAHSAHVSAVQRPGG